MVSAPSIAGYLGQFLRWGWLWRRGGGGHVLRRTRGQPEQRRDGVLSDSGRRLRHGLPAPLSAPSVRSGSCTGRSTASPPSPPPTPFPAAGGLGRVDGGSAVSDLRSWVVVNSLLLFIFFSVGNIKKDLCVVKK
jgi:hypothetical protein